jgi:predicted nuclease with RNAse H fold
MKLTDMNLLGVDVGYSARRRTTGIAWRIGDTVGAVRAGTLWSDRQGQLPSGVTFSVAALDAPILPDHQGCPLRGCEAVFYGGAFWNRCRPGFSHHGRGLALRKAGREAAWQFALVLDGKCIAPAVAVRTGVPIVEAFPNTFLGVLLAESAFEKTAKSETKSDWLYRMAVGEGSIDRALQELGWTEAETISAFENERDHELCAAFVCLLTAGFAAAGTATVIGDATHGWFWLPPQSMWQAWACDAVERQIRIINERGLSRVTRWSGLLLA